ncbi:MULTISPECIES: lanthionine synthetase LanC family protein [unclassified Bacteroides]|uniref:lanthionine synthetase LanC family protein n=1 Tax=unclassified Bacteroides TaxID=2646097 RepID=UPI0013ED412A|nr:MULTISPECIES: lanthionine synthetase LanC family protein [unclassified Bacteroides]QTO26231.1 hypothetical protein G7Y45_01145 [Bacteroides sp. ZJ-18]
MINDSLLKGFDLCYDQIHKNVELEKRGIVSGEIGALFCLYYLYKLTGEHRYRNEMYQLANQMIEKEDTSLSLGSGLAGLCLTLHWLGLGYLVNDQMEEVDRMLEQEYYLMLDKNDLDYYHGASGYLFYFLQKQNYVYLDSLVMAYQKRVEMNWKKHDWLTPFFEERGMPVMVTNLGTPHGITGILLILLIAKEKCHIPLETIITSICNLLLNYRFTKKKCSFFPSVIKQDGMKQESGIAWCYGDIMACYGILKAGLLMNNAYYTEVGLWMLLQLNNRTDYMKDDLCLCHGYSSLMYIYRQIYEMTKDESFCQSSLFWYNSAVSSFDIKIRKYEKERAFRDFMENPSLFMGVSGPFLALLTWETEYTEWTKCLLL